MENENTPTPDSAELKIGTPEYDAAMIEKFDDAQTGDQSAQTGTQEAPADERPSWLPEKFASAEDLAKAYAALEAKQSQGGDTPAADEGTPEAQAEKLVTDAGLDFDALSAKFAAEGALSAEDYAALEGAGIPKSMVDAYIEGQTAIATQHRATLLSAVGGEDGFTAASQWAADNLPAADIEAFNAVMDGGDMGAMKLALAGLKAQFDAAGGSEPTLLSGETGQSTGDVFRSTAELTAAMKDPRYHKDPAYRADIEKKLARSNVF